MFSGTLRDRVSVSRMVSVTATKRRIQEICTNVPCKILPMDTNKAQNLGISISQGYEAYFNNDADIKAGDVLTDQDTDVYNVTGVQKYKNAGTASHIRVVMELK